MDLHAEFGRIVGAPSGESVRHALAGGIAVSIDAGASGTGAESCRLAPVDAIVGAPSTATRLPAGFAEAARERARYALAAGTARPPERA